MDNVRGKGTNLKKIYNLPKLNQEEIEKMNRPTTNMDIENCNQKSSNKQKPRTTWLHRRILPCVERRANIYPIKTLQENCRGRRTPKLIV